MGWLEAPPHTPLPAPSIPDGPIHFPLTDVHSASKVDPLNYALQPGGGVNATALCPLELLHPQNELVAACSKKRSGAPSQVVESLSLAFIANAIIPLVKPSILQAVHVRRQHVDFATGTRAKRPCDLYSYPSTPTSGRTTSEESRGTHPQPSPQRGTARHAPGGAVQVRRDVHDGETDNEFDDSFDENDENNEHDGDEDDIDNNIDRDDDDDSDIREIHHINRSLSKRGRSHPHIDS
ncbi:LOW QUALITY PROTEIN: Hypothetical protein PHPALM_14282 [Phytophthora palmivora]|uniref:Uncharacterized protein n=1 Tax=Phytophthora palmivora TaxID=4796 RepID=A0A2P4XV65_9STRA|nr:LOW QUALITY PROTEIN: Hypothetical protein PHPALM_14282 [Phytophthora palmivora]